MSFIEIELKPNSITIMSIHYEMAYIVQRFE